MNDVSAMQEKWRIWIYVGSSSTDCMAIDTTGKIFRIRVKNKDISTGKILRKKEAVSTYVVRLMTSTGINDELPPAELQAIAKPPGSLSLNEGINSLLILGNERPDHSGSGDLQSKTGFIEQCYENRTLFDHVIEVNEQIHEHTDKKLLLSENEINPVLRQVFLKKPGLVFIALNNPLLEMAFSNLLKTAGYRHVVASHELRS